MGNGAFCVVPQPEGLKVARDKSTEVDLVNPDSIDAEIMSRVGRESTVEIAKRLGLTPHEVKRRVSELLDSIDVLTIQQQRARLMIQLNEISSQAIARIQEIGSNIDDREYAAVLNASTNAIKVSLAELARMEKADDSKVDALNELRVRELIRLMDRVVNRSVAEVAVTFGVDEQSLLDIFRDNLVACANEMDAAEVL